MIASSNIQQAVFSSSMKVCGHREDREDTSQEVIFEPIELVAAGLVACVVKVEMRL
jgi:hypothetical protein